MEKGTVAICFVRQAVSELISRGVSPDTVLQEAGISPSLLRVEQARVSADSYAALWLGVAQALDDEFFGQDSGRLRCGSFTMLCHAISSCQTVGQGLERAGRFLGLLLNDVQVRVERSSKERGRGGAALVLSHPGARAPSTFAQETMLVLLQGVMCWLARRRVPIMYASFNYAEPDHSAEYLAMYSRDLRFDQPRTELGFDDSVLDRLVHHDEGSVKAFLRRAPYNFIVKYADESSVAARIRKLLRGSPPAAWPGFEELSSKVHLSESSLRRRLMDEGSSYQEIKDRLRRDLAIEMLTHTDTPVAEIADQLGFAETAAFHRAFRRWTGSPVGSYRVR
nr:AraC family transcriptional regulator [uncultured Cupriavidus sp.]